MRKTLRGVHEHLSEKLDALKVRSIIIVQASEVDHLFGGCRGEQHHHNPNDEVDDYKIFGDNGDVTEKAVGSVH